MIWVIEDLHFAPEIGRSVAVALSRAAVSCRSLVLMTTRPQLGSATRSALRQLEGLVHLRLEPLPEPVVAQLLLDLGTAPETVPVLAHRIATRSEGLPLFVIEMLRSLQEQGALERDAQGRLQKVAAIREISVPGAARELFGARLARLGPADRTLLELAATQGLEFDARVIASVQGRLFLEVLQDLARIERTSGLLHAAGHGFAFDHQLIQQVAYESMSAETARSRHTQLAAAVLRVAPTPTEETALRVARHALRGEDPVAGLEYLDAALAHCAQQFLHEAAVDLLRDAVDRAGPPSVHDHITWLLRSNDLLDTLGRRDAQRAVLDEAAAVADRSGDAALRARVLAASGRHRMRSGDTSTDLEAEFERALALARGAGARQLEIEILSHQAHNADRVAKYEQALALYEAARSRLEPGDAPRVQMFLLGGMGQTLQNMGRLDEARACYEQAMAVALATGDKQEHLRATAQISFLTYRKQPQGAGTRQRLMGLREAAQRAGDKYTAARAVANLCALLGDQGHWGDAHALCQESHALALEIGDRSGVVVTRANLGVLESYLGDQEEALRLLTESAQEAEYVDPRVLGILHTEIGRVRLWSGEPAAAQEILARARAAHADAGNRDREAEALVWLSVTAAAADDHARAHGLARAAVEAAEAGGSRARKTQAVAQLAAVTADAALLSTAASRLRDPRTQPDAFERLTGWHGLWRASGEHLDEAGALLDTLIEHAPATRHDAMLTRVPLYREIARARAG